MNRQWRDIWLGLLLVAFLLFGGALIPEKELEPKPVITIEIPPDLSPPPVKPARQPRQKSNPNIWRAWKDCTGDCID